MTPSIHKLDFSTSHHQFYICDKETSQNTGDDDFWTEEATLSRLAIGNGILGVGLECYGPLKGELVLIKSKKDMITYNQYDHIVEGGLDIPSGILQVLDCPFSNIELEVKIPPGKYRVRIYSANLASVVDQEEGDDYYRVEIWPDTNMERIVIKQYKEKNF
ncbi:hypothetical protein GA0116948_12518 [Chitinophaga costaii]|uniref:Uncharacterized protein n=1 Tax=Chitinophaga costaii TaxID=1335309 RepID=A0A1C4G6R7_9BACT|nr:hypothetical protein [Chitinophaga costaii]PUZ19588.1 hypothetical protein DCM91_20345 [Chitinophaga costaii]SCC63898.1 hypothetical protein GA0116948_12518 [Chitinophaga costaii]